MRPAVTLVGLGGYMLGSGVFACGHIPIALDVLLLSAGFVTANVGWWLDRRHRERAA